MKALDILYRSDQMVAINKPHGLLVHASSIARDADVNALKVLRDQLDQYVFPIHRLDRKTAGVLLFGLNKEIVREVKEQFDLSQVSKRYIAIVRGYFPEQFTLDYPLTNDRGKLQEAITTFRLLHRSEIAVPYGQHNTSRYSLIECYPKTGRFHQIRKHLAHMRHPIIGDRPHGCNKQNKLFKERWNMTTMMLHAIDISLNVDGRAIHIQAPIFSEFHRMLTELQLREGINKIENSLS